MPQKRQWWFCSKCAIRTRLSFKPQGNRQILCFNCGKLKRAFGSVPGLTVRKATPEELALHPYVDPYPWRTPKAPVKLTAEERAYRAILRGQPIVEPKEEPRTKTVKPDPHFGAYTWR